MAIQIPASDGPTVTPGVAPRVRGVPPPNPGGGRAVERAYGQARGLAGDVSEIVFHEEMKAQEAQFNELAGRAEKAALDRQQALSKVQGKAALQASQEALRDFDKDTETIYGEASSDFVRERLKAHQERTRMGLQKFAEPYAQREMEKYAAREFQARRENLFNQAVLSNGDPLAIALSIDEAQQLIKRNGILNGIPEEEWKLEQAKDESAIHTGVIHGFYDSGRDIDAKNYFEANKGSLIPADLHRLSNLVANGSSLGEAQRLADLLEGEASLSAARGKLKEMSKLDPKTRAQAEDILQEKFRIKKQEEHERSQERYSMVLQTALKYGKGRTAQQVAGPVAWSKLTGQQQAELTSFIEDINKNGQPSNYDPKITEFALMPPSVRATLTEKDMLTMFRPYMDNATYKHSLEQVAKDKQGGRNVTGADVLRALASNNVAGITPQDTEATVRENPAKAKAFSDFYRTLERVYDSEKPKSFKEEEEILNRALFKRKVVDQSFRFPVIWDFTPPPTLEKRTFELGSGDRIPLANVSPENYITFKKRIAAAEATYGKKFKDENALIERLEAMRLVGDTFGAERLLQEGD